MKAFFTNLASSKVARSWIIRQALKGAAAVQTGLAVALANVQVEVSGQTVDLIPAQTELALVAAVGALIVGGAEVALSYAVAHFGKAE